MVNYSPIYKSNQLFYGNGKAVVITGWTNKESVVTKLDKNQYCVIGALHSPNRGLNFLIRNLLANPWCKYLSILNATDKDKSSGACDALINFLKEGFELSVDSNNKPCWKTKNGIGILDIQIDKEALELLRKNIIFKECLNIQDIHIFISTIPTEEDEPWGERLTFDEPEINNEILPGARYGHRIEGENIAETWVKIIHLIRKTGTIRNTGYDGKWQELIDLIAVVNNEPENFYFPSPNYLPLDKKFLKKYIPQIIDDSPYEDGVKYTYGQRLRSWFFRDQIEDVIDKLIKEIDSASAVMNLWDSGRGFNNEISTAPYGRNNGDSDHQHGGSPCLNHIWLRVVEGELSMTATFRSNDMFSAWVSNAMGLRALQRYIRDEIANRSEYDLRMGPLITISQSAHIYDDCWENADGLIKNQYHKIFNNRNYNDHAGNFIIELTNDGIKVEQQDKTGNTVKIYSNRLSRKLYQEIAEYNPYMSTEHAMYIGTELHKAEIALTFAAEYEQDKPLTVWKKRY